MWALTHLGSGHQLCRIKGTVATVFPIASEIAESGDWSFDGLDGWRNQFPDAKEKLEAVAAKHPKLVVFTTGRGRDLMSAEIARQIMMARI